MEVDVLLQRISSEPSEQSKSPSQTEDLAMHSPFMQVASLTPHAVVGRVVGSTTAGAEAGKFNALIACFISLGKFTSIYPCEIQESIDHNNTNNVIIAQNNEINDKL